MAILDKMEGEDPILVGGQSVNVWAQHYAGRHPVLRDTSRFVSKDVDVFDNMSAARKLAGSLRDGQILLPGPDDHTPNAAIVIGQLEGRRIAVDFMAEVLGVDRESIQKKFVTISGTTREGKRIGVMVMNPIDCVASRLANVNRLRRGDPTSLRQAEASIAVAPLFLADLIDGGDVKDAQRLLHGFEQVVRTAHIGKDTHLKFGERLDPSQVLRHFVNDERLDVRWREKILRKALERVEGRAARRLEREAEGAKAVTTRGRR